MKTPNPEYLDRVNQLVNQCPFFELLSMKIVDVGIGFSVLEMDLSRKHMIFAFMKTTSSRKPEICKA